jgi:hypothetical protein
VRARHILITANTSSDTLGNTTKSPRKQAREAVEKDKQQKQIDEIVARSHVTVAENFSVAPK